MKKVIFDTDIGIDDAMALLFLHYSPDVELHAIISGFGNASIENTTRNALYIKEYFDIGAAVYRGAAHPLQQEFLHQYPDFVHGRNGLGDIEIAEPRVTEEELSGAQAIVSLARQYPKQLSIVAVGRLTNLAQALALCPELPDLIHEVVVMGGAFGFNGHTGNVTAVAEANIAGDALAADIVFNSGMPMTIVGLDVTHETIADLKFFDDLRDRAGEAGAFIHRISRCYLDFHERTQGKYECPLHDASAVAYLLNPASYVTQEGSVRVVTEGSHRGQTVMDTACSADAGQEHKICRVCTAVDAEAVRELYVSTLGLAAD
ncbi:MAG: nucleoside hydrolase [Proteobacteria bacterium]|nr:nucleoside hydrolase [Pseudomonadota bacterium]